MSNDEFDKLQLNNDEVVEQKILKKKKEQVLVDTPIAKYISSEDIYILYCVVNDEIILASSQIFEQIEVIQGLILTGISKLNDSVPDKKIGVRAQQKMEKGSDIAY